MLATKISSGTNTKLSPKAYLVPGLILIGVLVSAFVIVLPKYRQIGPLKSSIQKNEKKLAQLTVKSNYLKGLNQQNLTTRAGYLVKVLPEEKKVPYLFSLFKLIAQKNNLSVESISVSPGPLTENENKGDGIPLLSFDQSLEGKMSDIKNYFAQLARTAPLMVVESFSLTRSRDSGEGEEVMELSMMVKTPYLFMPEEIGSIETPLTEMTSDDDLTFRRVSNLVIESDLESQISRKVPVGKPNPFSF